MGQAKQRMLHHSIDRLANQSEPPSGPLRRADSESLRYREQAFRGGSFDGGSFDDRPFHGGSFDGRPLVGVRRQDLRRQDLRCLGEIGASPFGLPGEQSAMLRNITALRVAGLILALVILAVPLLVEHWGNDKASPSAEAE